MLDRLKRSRVAQVIGAYGSSQAGNYASGLALSAFLAMFPLILGILSIAGFVARDRAMQDRLYAGVVSLFPADAHSAITAALTGVRHNAGLLGAIAIVGMLWGGSGLFSSMEFALTKIFGTTQRDMLRQRLMGLVMMLVFVIAVILTVTANSAAAASPAGGVGGSAVGALVLVALMIAIYRWVPNRTFSLRDIWPGAVLAGVCIEVFSLIFPLYARLSHNFGTYGQQFGLFFLLATWLLFMSQFILLGAVFNKVRLGAPQDEGLVASSPADSRKAADPAQAIEREKRKTASDREAPAVRRRPADKDVSTGPETRAAAGIWMGSTLIGAVTDRLRTGRSRAAR